MTAYLCKECLQGYPVHIPRDVFLGKYGILLHRDSQTEDQKAAAISILNALNLPSTEWQVGKTKVWFCGHRNLWHPYAVGSSLFARLERSWRPPCMFWECLSLQAKSGRLHLNTHTPLTQRSQSGLTMPLSKHSVGTYRKRAHMQLIRE